MSLLLLWLRYDFIEIRDGTSDTADVLGRHCSNIAPPPIISSGSSLQIRFVSDYAHQGAGFSLRYEIFKTGEEVQQKRTRKTTQLNEFIYNNGVNTSHISSSGGLQKYLCLRASCISL